MEDSLKAKRMSAVRILALGFAITILTGGVILSLPICSSEGKYTNLLDSIFTATSAVCVTGLVTVDTGTYWNAFGQFVIMMLIEIGGLGFMSITTFVAVLLGKKITLRERLIMQEAMNTFKIQGVVNMLRYVIGLTICIQLIGALLLSIVFIPRYGGVKGVFYSLFHSVSAFGNAGFDLMGNFSSLTNYNKNYLVIIVLGLLIIVGGIGFTVLIELINYPTKKKMSVHSKLALLVTSVLILWGTTSILLVEYNNPSTLQNMTFGQKILNSFFSAVTPRTAGFNSISTGGMTIAGKFTTIILMFIGGSPGSTAGGLKTVTFGLLVLTVLAAMEGREDAEVFGRRFAKETVYKSFALLFISMALVLTVTMILTVTEPSQRFIDLLYEATSAFSTAGLTTGVTQELTNWFSKVILILTMYCGRVGPLTVILAIIHRRKKTGLKYPKGNILIG